MTRRRTTDTDTPDAAEAEAVRRALASPAAPRRGASRARGMQRTEQNTAVGGPSQDAVHAYILSLGVDPQQADPLVARVLRNQAAHQGSWVAYSRKEAANWHNLNRPAPTVAPGRPSYGCPLCPGPEPAARLPDPKASRAVLIGVGRSPGLPDLPTAEASAVALGACFQDTVARPAVLRGPDATREQIRRQVARAADEASDLLILHVSGHGLTEHGTGRLHLATDDATMPLTELHDAAAATRARHVLVLLDVCATSRAAAAAAWAHGPRSAAYMITATGGEPALARNPVRDTGTTAFAGALVSALTRGVPGGGKLLDLATLYTDVARRLSRDTLPRPRLYAWGEPARWALAPNRHPRAATGSARPDPELAELIARARAGDAQAWHGLVERHHKLVWSIVRKFSLSSDEAADVYHTTWLRLVEHLEEAAADTIAQFLISRAHAEAVGALQRRTASPCRPQDEAEAG